ncbi:MAG: acyltransferase [Kiritimatiellia bacterium]|jgi:acetyltransferase-like isoleucine patch superfamily enzyme
MSLTSEKQSGKLKNTMRGSGSAASKYFAITYGPMPRWKAVCMELTTLFLSGIPGALGLFLRGKLYRPFFASFGRGVAIGRNVVFRHSCKISLGDGVVIDDQAVVDAKGDGNAGIQIGPGAYVGRNTIIYCKGGDIALGRDVNLSANCIVFSSNRLEMKPGTMVGAFSYLLSGGEYDHRSPTPFSQQSGMETKGPLEIGAGCWIGARVTVLDGATIGDRCAIGAGAVVTRPLPPRSLAVGVPAKAIGAVTPETPEPPDNLPADVRPAT